MHSSLNPYGERTLARVHRGRWLAHSATRARRVWGQRFRLKIDIFLNTFNTWTDRIEIRVTWSHIYGNVSKAHGSHFDSRSFAVGCDLTFILAWGMNSYPWQWKLRLYLVQIDEIRPGLRTTECVFLDHQISFLWLANWSQGYLGSLWTAIHQNYRIFQLPNIQGGPKMHKFVFYLNSAYNG